MLEQQRLDYLQAMGVVQWLARKPLPYAPPSRYLAQGAEPDAAPAPARNLTELLADIAPALVKETVKEAATDTAKDSRKEAAKTPAPAAIPELIAPVDLTPPEFELFFVRNAFPVIWVVSRAQDVPMLHEFASTVQRALLAKTDFLDAPLRFGWPFIRSRKENQSRAVALQALRAQWDFFQNQGAQAALCFDETSQEWLAASDVPCIFISPYLPACLSSAAYKKALWLALLPYCPQ
ncbi:MAG: hypothetical protein RL217_1680 [Pseudomonadota bacterium]